MHSKLAKLKTLNPDKLTKSTISFNKKFIIMRKIFFLVAFLSASIMSFAYTTDPGAWIGSTDAAYANQFKWSEVEGVAAPSDVVNIQQPGFAGEIGIYVTFADAAFNAVYFNGVLVANEAQYKQDGAGAVFYLSALTAKNTEILIKNGETVRFGLNVYNDKGETGELDSDIDSEYCGEVMSSGNTTAAFTWETKADGSVVITISEALGGDDAATHFRGNGISIEKFTVGDTNEPAATYFDHSCAGNKVTLTPKAGVEAPAFGTKIHVNAIIEYTTSLDGNAWPTLQFEYTYGGVCKITPELTKIVLSASAVYAQVGETITLTAKGKDQLNHDIDADITLSISPASAGTLNAGVLTLAQPGAVTVTAQSGEISKEIVVYCVPSANLALNQPCEGGYYDNNPAESFDKANDGDTNTAWVTYANRPATEEWWYVDLGDKYTLFAIDVTWGDPASKKYILQVRDDAPSDSDKADDEAWETVLNDVQAGNNSEQFNVVNAAGRYVRLRSLDKTADFLRLKEVRIFGTEYVATDDDEAPVLVSAALESKTWNSAMIAVAATDNNGVTKYHVVDAANGIDAKYAAAEGKITVTGLTAGTAYNFVITALDAAQNESENSVTVSVTTDARQTSPVTAAPVPTWPAAQVKSIYSDAYDFTPASLNSYNEGWWDNPNMVEEAIGEDHYLNYDLYRNGMIGAQMAETSVATMEKFHIDVFASASGSVTFRLICAGDAEAINQTKQTLELVGGQWNSFDFDLSDFNASHNWTRFFQYAIEAYQAGGLVGEHICVDNMYFYRTTELVDTEAPTGVSASVLSYSYFGAMLSAKASDNSGAVLFEVKNGEEIVGTAGGASGADITIVVSGLLPNTEYNLAVVAKDDAGNMAEAIQVAATTAVAPAPAPKPGFTGKSAVAVFCDELDGGPAIAIGGWGQSTVVTNGELAAGDHVQYLSNFNYLGWELAPAVNATGMEYLHLDIYSTSMTSVKVTPISPGHEQVIEKSLTSGEWTSLDIALSEYAAADIEWNNVFQFKFDGGNGGDFFVDNVYFYKNVGQGTSVVNTEIGEKAIKMIENGQLIIIRDGKRYNVTGVRVQ